MERVDCLIRGGIVLTIDDDGSLWEPGYVAVRGGIIIETGVFDPSVEARLCPKEVLDATGCVIMPGLINCHTHAAMTLFRGLADDMPLMKWLQEHIFPAEKKLKEEWVYWGTKLACAEMIMAGTTCFCDMYLFEQAVARAADEAGMRAIIGEVLYDFLSPNYGPLENGLGFTDALIREWKYHPRIRAVVEPHAVYTCSPDTLRQCLDLAEKHDVPMIVHLSETEDEVMECLKRYGRRPVQHLAHLGLLSPRLIAAHCVELDERDISALARNGVTVVHNPESNLKLGSGIAPVSELL
ncbi:MAG TPA: amidohydrolase, partial [Thermodesulforhabdus norvegica]|nr:amidohydrolase [Thermodesulforhabdus norvegica]